MKFPARLQGIAIALPVILLISLPLIDRVHRRLGGEGNLTIEVAKNLLNIKTEEDVKDDARNAALMAAAQAGHKQIVADLLYEGADPHAKNDKGLTALQIARNNKKYETAYVLQRWIKEHICSRPLVIAINPDCW